MIKPLSALTIQFIILVFLLSATAVFSDTSKESKTAPTFDTLAGPLPKIVKAKDGPYIVIADIEVPPNKIVTIEPGVIFLFKDFTGLHIQGKLIAKGTKTQPIVFSSEFDRTYNPSSSLLPNPYDWNGIYIHTDAFGTMMAHCTVAFTVYGIISDSKFIRLDEVTFRDNGKMNLKIEGREHTVTDKPYSYALSVADATVDGVQINLLKDPVAPRRNITRYTGLAAVIGGIGLGVYYSVKLSDSWKEYEYVTDIHNKEIVAATYTEAEYNDVIHTKNTDLGLTGLGYGIAVLGILGFTWTFTF